MYGLDMECLELTGYVSLVVVVVVFDPDFPIMLSACREMSNDLVRNSLNYQYSLSILKI
jgi:hypothetical protein